MKRITLHRAAVEARMPSRKLGSYQESIIKCGHNPGALSGSNLKGEARKYGGRYKRSRDTVVAAVAAASSGRIRDGYDGRGRRVWIDHDDGTPVQIDLL